MSAIERRIARLEASIQPIKGCDACLDQIGTMRFVTVNELGEVDASRPKYCPVCGGRTSRLLTH